MPISLIAAMSENRVIGRGGDLPWRLPDDLRFFKLTTTGHPVIMGRRTFHAVHAPLPNRTNIVLTRSRDFTAEGAIVAHDLDEAIDAARTSSGGDEEIFIIGGGEIYAQALARAARIHLTRIHADLEGDTLFPEFDEEGEWQRVAADHHPADDRHAYAFTIERWERVSKH